MVMNKRVWRVLTFTGWWMTFLAVALTLFFAYSWLSTLQSVTVAALALSLFGLLVAGVGEFMLGMYSDKKHRFVWEALSMSGIFCLAAGLLWVAVQLQSITGIVVLLASGIVLILISESKVGKK